MSGYIVYLSTLYWISLKNIILFNLKKPNNIN